MAPTDKERMRRVLSVLGHDVVTGAITARAARSLLEADENERITCCRSFFVATYDALIRETLLYYCKLMVNRGESDDSVNLPYLLNLAESKPAVFRPGATPLQVRERARQHRVWVDSMGTLTLRVMKERDCIIAHLDRGLVNSPEKLFAEPPVPMSQVERAFAKLVEIVNVYKEFYDGTAVSVAAECARVAADVRHLFERLHAIDRPGSRAR